MNGGATPVATRVTRRGNSSHAGGRFEGSAAFPDHAGGDGLFHIGVHQACAGEVGTSEVGAGQIHVDELGATQVSALQVGVRQVHVGELAPGQLGVGEIAARQVGVDEVTRCRSAARAARFGRRAGGDLGVRAVLVDGDDGGLAGRAARGAAA